MNWTLIPSDQIPGICRGYVIRYIRKEGTKDVPRNVTVSANTNTALITNLAGYILYDFWISGLTYPTLIGPNTTVTLRTIDWCKYYGGFIMGRALWDVSECGQIGFKLGPICAYGSVYKLKC